MPLLSIIVPIYNVEKYLRRCIDSILEQTFCNYELILVDDGSPDHCGEIIDEYAKKDSRVVPVHQNNGGVGSARNSGLNIAKGEYLTFVDPDDYISACTYDTMIDKMTINNLDICICLFSYDNIYDLTHNYKQFGQFLLFYFYQFEIQKVCLMFHA